MRCIGVLYSKPFENFIAPHTTEYRYIYEQGETNWGAIVPDLPGCVSVGDTFEEVQATVKEAIALYLEVLAERGEEPSEPSMRVGLGSL